MSDPADSTGHDAAEGTPDPDPVEAIPLSPAAQSSRLTRLGRILPIFGVVLVLLPAFWNGPEPVRTSQAMIYVFAIWLILALATWGARRAVSKAERDGAS